MGTYDDFVGARRSTLIEELGGGADAEAAVDRALSRCRRRWARLEHTTDVESHVRELASDELDRPRRRRITLVALLALAVLAAGAVVVALQPAPPQVRAEVNPVPVPWFAEGRLHLAEVVVTLPGAGAFAPLDEGVVVEDDDGSLLLVEADGKVSGYDGAMPDIPEPEIPVPYDNRGELGERVAVAVAPGGESVHLMEIAAAGPDAGIYVRLSETISRLFVVCTTPQCTMRSRVVVEGRDVRLR